jgi:hypothetical protein
MVLHLVLAAWAPHFGLIEFMEPPPSPPPPRGRNATSLAPSCWLHPSHTSPCGTGTASMIFQSTVELGQAAWCFSPLLDWDRQHDVSVHCWTGTCSMMFHSTVGLGQAACFSPLLDWDRQHDVSVHSCTGTARNYTSTPPICLHDVVLN